MISSKLRFISVFMMFGLFSVVLAACGSKDSGSGSGSRSPAPTNGRVGDGSITGACDLTGMSGCIVFKGFESSDAVSQGCSMAGGTPVDTCPKAECVGICAYPQAEGGGTVEQYFYAPLFSDVNLVMTACKNYPNSSFYEGCN